MIQSPLVSIVCTSYNHEDFIKQTLESFIKQKTNFQFEILVHDDASTDSTSTIIRQYEVKYPKLFKTIYQSENQYTKKVVNIWYDIIFPLAKGKYIALCEGDDYWLDENKLQKQIDFMEANEDYSLCCHNALINRNQVSLELFSKYNRDKDITIAEVLNSWIAATSTILFKKKSIKAIEEIIHNYEIISGDQTLFLFAIINGKIRYIRDVMSVYRMMYKGSSLTAQTYKFPKKHLCQLHTLYVLISKYLDGEQLSLIKQRIKLLENEIQFIELKGKGMIITFFKMPKFFILKSINKCFSLWPF